MESVLFLEVDNEDVVAVHAEFPDAAVEKGVLSDEALVARCRGYAVVSCFIHTRFSAEVLKKLPDLKLLCTRSVGYDHIDTQYCAEHGITVCNVPDYGSHVIAEHVFALLLSTVRHILEGDRRVQAGTFDYHGLRGMALKGKTIGILGTGKIGRCVADIAHGFGMHILATDQCRNLELMERYGAQYVEFDRLLKESDVLTLHVPATPETTYMFNDTVFSRMKKGVILVNTARGALIDSEALVRALDNGTVAWALLDVLEHEANLSESKSLVGHPRVVATPHVAFYADDSMKNMYGETLESIRRWLAGKEPEHVVRPPRVVCDLPPASRA